MEPSEARLHLLRVFGFSDTRNAAVGEQTTAIGERDRNPTAAAAEQAQIVLCQTADFERTHSEQTGRDLALIAFVAGHAASAAVIRILIDAASRAANLPRITARSGDRNRNRNRRHSAGHRFTASRANSAATAAGVAVGSVRGALHTATAAVHRIIVDTETGPAATGLSGATG